MILEEVCEEREELPPLQLSHLVLRQGALVRVEEPLGRSVVIWDAGFLEMPAPLVKPSESPIRSVDRRLIVHAWAYNFASDWVGPRAAGIAS